MAKRERSPEFTSPIGVFKWPKLVEPDYGTDAYPNPNGSYNVRLVLPKDAPETKAFLKELEPLYKQAMMEAEERFSQLPVGSRKKLGEIKFNPVWAEVYDPETEEPTGDIEIKVSTPASGTYKGGPRDGQQWTRTLPLFDSEGRRIKGVKAVSTGSQGRVRIAARPYFIPATGIAGLSLRLVGVQITNLIAAGERSASGLGFGKVDGGYVFEETTDPFAAEATQENATGDF